MTKDKKQRTQYNWKFKDNESESFYEWFNNQDNISSSLRNMVYHMIDLYGTQDILDPATQKQIVKDSLLLESFRGQNVLHMTPSMSSYPNYSDEHQYPIHETNEQHHQREVLHETHHQDQPFESKTIYADIDPNNL